MNNGLAKNSSTGRWPYSRYYPGPEAHELCVYFGMKAGGRTGGFLAGLAFMLPGFLLMLLFTWLYVKFGLRSPTLLVYSRVCRWPSWP